MKPHHSALLVLLSVAVALSPTGESVAAGIDSNALARVIVERVLENRPAHDLALKARLSSDRDEPVPVEILVKNLPEEVRTIYRLPGTEALIVQPRRGAPRYYLKGVGELTGPQRLRSLGKSQFTLYDLGLPFLHWPEVAYRGEARVRARPCHLLEVKAPGEPYASVRLWIDKEANALLRAEGENEYGQPVRRFSVTSFRHVGEIWVPRGMQMAFVPPGQSLPAEEQSRLEVFEGNYEATLPAGDFEPEKFGR